MSDIEPSDGDTTRRYDRDIVGYDVITREGLVGHVSKAANVAGQHWLVVDTGLWVFGKKYLIPAGAVARVDHVDSSVTLALTRAQIRTAPCYVKERMPTSPGLLAGHRPGIDRT